jgi:hypothetical protein
MRGKKARNKKTIDCDNNRHASGRKRKETYTRKSKHPPNKSLGALFTSNKSKPKSPDATGQLRLQRHTFEAISLDFHDSDCDEIVCNIAAWRNRDRNGEPYLTIELSPRFRSAARTNSIFDIYETTDE